MFLPPPNIVLIFYISLILSGCDEVYSLGKSAESQAVMKKEGLNKSSLYLRWVKSVASHVRSHRSGAVTPIIWDDMLRQWDVKSLKVMYM